MEVGLIFSFEGRVLNKICAAPLVLINTRTSKPKVRLISFSISSLVFDAFALLEKMTFPLWT